MLASVGLGRVASLFVLLEVAEEEIAAACRVRPRDEAAIRAIFTALYPPPLLRDKSPETYRAHVRELIARIAAGESLEPGTKAECLSALLRASGSAPLNRIGQALTERLFAAVLPDLAAEFIPSPFAPEPHEGACEEELAGLRRRCGVAGRGKTARGAHAEA